jgi:Lar family restriction alleviation protein
MEALKPCPFCGSDDINVFEDDYEYHYIAHACKTGDISVYVKYVSINTEGHTTKAEAVNAWNMRASL